MIDSSLKVTRFIYLVVLLVQSISFDSLSVEWKSISYTKSSVKLSVSALSAPLESVIRQLNDAHIPTFVETQPYMQLIITRCLRMAPLPPLSRSGKAA
jgi:hypothetical protein